MFGLGCFHHQDDENGRVKGERHLILCGFLMNMPALLFEFRGQLFRYWFVEVD